MTTRVYIVDTTKYLRCLECGIPGFKGEDNWCSRPDYRHMEIPKFKLPRITGISTQ